MAIAEIFPLTDTSLDILELRHRRRETALHQFVQAAADRRALRHPGLVESQLVRRERLGSTALGRGFAVTGIWSLCIHTPLVLLGLSERGLDWDAEDGQPVHVVACVITPGDRAEDLHLRRVNVVVSALRLQRTRQRLLDRRDPVLLATLLREVPR
jgi:mannitol/fructose-specific phosphotransferase system IIA component (Ntr-type)